MIIRGLDLANLGDYLAIAPTSPSGLVWVKRPPGSRVDVGAPAFTTKTPRGYFQGKLFGKSLLAHRVVYVLAHGSWPQAVDHIDGNPQNNSPDNLRACTTQTNQFNTTRRTTNRSGFKGVYKHGKSWVARICIDGVAKRLGAFPNPELAAKAYTDAAKELHGDFYTTRT